MKQVDSRIFRMILTLLFGVFLSVGAYAQSVIAVKGHVKDAMGEVIGANVVEKSNPGNGTITDVNGDFTLKVKKGATLVVSFVGYITQEVKAAPRIEITLEDDSELLDEAVVIGYGVAKKNDLTGSVTAIKPDAMNRGLVTAPQDMMMGKIAGVNVMNNNGGKPGGGATIRIRGGSSLNASNDPLIVIDGLAMDNYGVEGADNALALVNPNDIESFTVLKDASATAIYGSRASNGVILITTKKGKQGDRPSIAYSGNVSVSTVKNTLDVMNAKEYMGFVQKLSGYEGNDEGFFASEEYANLGYWDAEGNHLFADTDWQDEIYRTAVSTDHNLTVSGGSKTDSYRISLGYTKQDGVVKNNDYERFTASFNYSPTFMDEHLKFNINAKGMYSVTNNIDEGSAIGNATSMDPTKPVRAGLSTRNGAVIADYGKDYAGFWQWPSLVTRDDPEWLYGVNTLAPTNPVSVLNLYSKEGKSKVLMGNLEADYKVHGLEDLHLHVNMGMDVASGKSHANKSPYYYDSGTYYFGNYGWNSKNTYNLSLNMYAQYLKDFGKNHHIDVMAGYEWQHFHIETDYFYRGFYQDTHLQNPGAEYLPSENTLYKSENYLVSFFGRFNYSLKNRYLLTFTLRNDGSSRFSEDNRWGLFPSVALAWKMKEEGFLKNVDAVSDAKLRVGYGITGQQEGIGDYTYFASYTPNSQGAYYPIVGNGETYRPNAYNNDLTWERTTTYNAGIDLGFWNDRVVANVDWYYRKTTDLINTVYVACGSNFAPKLTSNIGSLHNQGLELALTWRAIQTKNWRWELNYNVTWNDNEIDELVASQGKDYIIKYGGVAVGDSGSDGIKAWAVGQSSSAYYTLQQVYDKNGQPIEGEFVDRDGNGIINADDRYFYKKSDADVLMGLTSKLTYKNWDLGVSFRASLGNYAYNATEASKSNLSYSGLYSGSAWHNVANMVLDKNWQYVSTNSALSDYFIQNASFLKCDNITLGYSFNKLFNAPISGRVYLTAQNVFTITEYKGLDPEINGGYDGSLYPRPFVGIFGLNLNF